MRQPATAPLVRAIRSLDVAQTALHSVMVKMVAVEMSPVWDGETYQTTVPVYIRGEDGKIVRNADTGKPEIVRAPVVCKVSVSRKWEQLTSKRRSAARRVARWERKVAAVAALMTPEAIMLAYQRA